MLVKKISDNAFLELIKYSIDKSNYISFFVQYNRCNPCDEYIVKIILEEENKDNETFFNTYALEDIQKFEKKYKYVNRIQELIQPYFKEFQGDNISFEDFVAIYVRVALIDAYYKYYSQKNLDNYMSELVYEQKHYYGINNDLLGITYYFKIDEYIKNSILSSKKKIWDWIYPYGLENISFLKDNQYWLKSVAHEKLCDIYCESEQEYRYLKSIGVEFYENEYVPISDEEKVDITVDGFKI